MRKILLYFIHQDKCLQLHVAVLTLLLHFTLYAKVDFGGLLILVALDVVL